MNPAKLHTIVRSVLALIAAGSAPAMHAAGYQGGAETTVGLDGGTLRDLTTVVLSLGAVFYPQLTGIWKAMTADPRMADVEKRLSALESLRPAAKPAEDSDESEE